MTPICRCTLGEISDALRAVWGDHVPTSSVVHNAYSSQYDASTDVAFDKVGVDWGALVPLRAGLVWDAASFSGIGWVSNVRQESQT